MFKLFKWKKKEAKETKDIKPTPAKEKKFIVDAIINAMPDVIIVLDLNGVILFVNPAHTKILGWKPEERIGKSFDEFGESIKAEDIEKFMKLLGELMETGYAEPVETIILTKDGREVPMSVTYSLIKDAEGNPEYIIASLRDISELKQAEEERRKAEAVQERAAIIDALPDPLIVLNLDGELISVNLAHLKMMGHKSADEILGKGFERFEERFPDPENDIPKFLGLFKEVIERGSTKEPVEIRLRREGGKEFFASYSASLLRDAQGNPKNVVVTLRDISELKLVEEKLRYFSEELELKVEERTKDLLKEKNHTRHLIESSTDFQLTIDDDGKIMDVNRAFEEFVGKSRGDIIGTLIYDYLPRKDTESFIKEIFEKKKVRNIELSIEVPGKEIFYYNLSGTLFTRLDGELGVYISARDMTEVRRQHDELLAKEKQLAHTSRLSTLGEMASAMAHEINQPLSIISMVAEGIFRDIEKDRIDISLLPKDLEDILHSIKRIDRIITHMRTFARQPGEWKLIEPEQILNNAFIILGEQFRVHSILVSRHIEKNLPAIKVDPNQLEQVFINILINADQVLDEKKSQKGQLGEGFQKQIVVNIFQEGEDVVFEFADNGYGVPDEIKSRIFEPFFTTKDPGEGTGLGLSIAYSILNQSLKGRIWVEDNKMRGASFKVAIPVDPSYRKEKK